MSPQLPIARAVWWSFAEDNAAKKKKKGNKCMLRYVLRVQRRDSPGYTAFHSHSSVATHEFDIGGSLVNDVLASNSPVRRLVSRAVTRY